MIFDAPTLRIIAALGIIGLCLVVIILLCLLGSAFTQSKVVVELWHASRAQVAAKDRIIDAQTLVLKAQDQVIGGYTRGVSFAEHMQAHRDLSNTQLGVLARELLEQEGRVPTLVLVNKIVAAAKIGEVRRIRSLVQEQPSDFAEDLASDFSSHNNMKAM